MLPENNTRTGFLEYAEYVAVRDQLPWYAKSLFVVAYHVGGRRGELTSIHWSQVDLEAKQIRLHGNQTKNKKPRTLPIYGDMKEWLVESKRIRDERLPGCPWVFYTGEGERLYWFYDAWDAACIRAKLAGLLFHDLRRSAVRNMERAGIPRNIAMSISGHRTESVYRRYDIVVEKDFTDASSRLGAFFNSMKEDAKQDAEHAPKNGLGTLLGTPDDFSDDPADDPEVDAGPNPGD
jgi:integrase